MYGPVIWSSQTFASDAQTMELRDGVLKLFHSAGREIWKSANWQPGSAGAYLDIQLDGNVVIYQPDSSDRHAVWASNSNGMESKGG